MQLFCNIKVAIQITAHPIFHERTKYFDIDRHFVREKTSGWADINITHWNQTAAR